jgi:hypothetical protein
MITRKRSSSTSSNAVQHWREVYVAALFETDQQKLPLRIAEAERALMTRAAELFALSEDNSEQGQTVDDALYALRALRSCLELKTREFEPGLEHSIPITGNRRLSASH